MQAVYYDGAFIDIDEYAVMLENRGYQFGDGIFETIRVYGGKCFAAEEHLERYRASMRALSIPITDTDGEMLRTFDELIEMSKISDGIIYFQLTRGTAPRSHESPERMTPHLSVILRDTPIHDDWQQNGIRVALTEDIRWLRCDICSLNLLGNVMTANAARAANAKKALLFRKDKNEITECNDANFFIVKDGVLWTHGADNFILNGITRTFIKEKIAPALSLTVVEKSMTPEFLKGAEEAFATNTADEVVPVTSIDREQIGDGTPGDITKKIIASYKEFITDKIKNSETNTEGRIKL